MDKVLFVPTNGACSIATVTVTGILKFELSQSLLKV